MNEPTPTASPTQPESLTRLLALANDESEAARRHAINALSLIGPDLAQRVVDLTTENASLAKSCAFWNTRCDEHLAELARRDAICDAWARENTALRTELATVKSAARTYADAVDAYDEDDDDAIATIDLARENLDALIGGAP